jgi:uncharacterized protein (TIGR02453 family)
MNSELSPAFFEFFKNLAANNHKDWFDENRKDYETNVKKPFEDFIAHIIDEMRKISPEFNELQPKDCIFRINRDIRFSKDKTPYKLNRSAIIAPGGRKSMDSVGFYFEIGPGECAFYAGTYMPEKEVLQQVRRKIAHNANQFHSIITKPEFVKAFGEVKGSAQKRLDSEFRDAAEKQPLIYNTQFYVTHEFEPEIVLKKNFAKYLLDLNQKALEFTRFLSTDK